LKVAYCSRRLCGPTTVTTGRFNRGHQDFNALHHRSNPSAPRFTVDPVFFDRVLEYASGLSNSGGSAIFGHCDDRYCNPLLTSNAGFEIAGCCAVRSAICFGTAIGAGFIIKIVSAGETVG
jgi:hypothetical protein